MGESEYRYQNPENRIAARRNLRRLLPIAEAKASEGKGTYEAASAHGDAMRQWVRIENAYGVHIYKTPLDGWIADIELKNVPDGFPKVIGTPVSMPLENRKDCERDAVGMLAMMIHNSSEKEPEAPTENVFIFHDLTIKLPHETIVKLSQARKFMTDVMPQNYVMQRLAEVSEKHGELSEEIMRNMSNKDRDEIVVVCALAMAERIPRWPPSEASSPKPNDDDLNPKYQREGH